MNLKCPLCHSEKLKLVHHLARSSVRYQHCGVCDLVFLEPAFHLKEQDEKARYSTHQNTRANAGYVKQFDFIRGWLQANIPLKAHILEFGCGPGPVLAELLAEDGFQVDIYDPHFFKDESVFSKKYDVITSTEAVEHFYQPKDELFRLGKILNSKGALILQTQFYEDLKQFENWYYAKDPTHVCFFHEKTWEKVAELSHMRIEHNVSPHMIFRKNE